MNLLIVACDFGHDFDAAEIGIEIPPSWHGRYAGHVIGTKGKKASEIVAACHHAISIAQNTEERSGDPSEWSDEHLIAILTRRAQARCDMKRMQIAFLQGKISEREKRA